ncbi:hypothetical protein GF312_03895 [Candidatus Poribacteria bacterium]|nr:hypothetical protein [Candidatus Poribacteria bacterium]
MKIYILCDMEGITGLHDLRQTWFSKDEENAKFAREGLKLLTDQLNWASEKALEAGVDELFVCDTHAGGHNVPIEDLISDPRITYEPPNGAELMTSMNESFDGLILLGHHAKANTENAFLSHTWTGSWADFRINDMSVGEIGIEACYAGHWNVPLIMVQGDRACCEEVNRQFPDTVTAAVKWAVSGKKAQGPTIEEARELTAGKIKEAVVKARNKSVKPFRPQLPMDIRLTLRDKEKADSIAKKDGVKRLDEFTVQVIENRHCDILKTIVG